MTAMTATRPEPATASYPRYPDVFVQLTGQDGNAYAIIGAVRRALRRARVPAAQVAAFTAEATSGNYDNVLATAMKWVDAA
jgi:hypothetical protein